ncbi:VanZ family protein [Neobacillus sp. NPDC093182]|uniref:VanZ family protein n=1 Tax=Neobacillus sp. NPDC093182 TaxID=3364297 RepID=UPI00380E942C
MRKRKWWILTAIAWMIAIFFFTQLPYFTGQNTGQVIQKVVVTEQQAVSATIAAPIDTNELNLLVRKTTHVIVFGILAFLLFKSLEALRFSYVLARCLTVFYAITDEWHQSFMLGRVAAYQDVLFDYFGAITVLSIIYLINKKKINVTN